MKQPSELACLARWAFGGNAVFFGLVLAGGAELTSALSALKVGLLTSVVAGLMVMFHGPPLRERRKWAALVASLGGLSVAMALAGVVEAVPSESVLSFTSAGFGVLFGALGEVIFTTRRIKAIEADADAP